jgi:hypothetical protein
MLTPYSVILLASYLSLVRNYAYVPLLEYPRNKALTLSLALCSDDGTQQC